MTDDKKTNAPEEEEEETEPDTEEIEKDVKGGKDEVGLDEEENKPVPPEEENKWVGGHTMKSTHPTVPSPDRAAL